MSFKFNITEEYKKMAVLHVSQTIKQEDAYLGMSVSEYELFKDFVGMPKNVLELGCGLGRMSVYLNSKLQDPSIHYILADTSYVSEDIKFGFNNAESYYNDLSLTEKFVREHGMTNFEIFDIRERNLNTLSNIDFVMSFLSVGFHSKIEEYIEDLLQITTSDCTMVFGVRRNKYFRKSFRDYFNERYLFENQFFAAGRTTKENILILREKNDRI